MIFKNMSCKVRDKNMGRGNTISKWCLRKSTYSSIKGEETEAKILVNFSIKSQKEDQEYKIFLMNYNFQAGRLNINHRSKDSSTTETLFFERNDIFFFFLMYLED